MADQVEQVMQDMVPELDDLSRKRIFDEAELKQIIRRRRDFEYLLHRNPSKPQDYLGYVQYEVALECLRRRRSKALHWRRKTLSDFAGIRRMHSIFNRGLAKFKADLRLWYQHVDFCLRSGSSKILSKVLMKAVKYHPREVHFWLLAADRELKTGHIKAARALLLRGIRFSPRSPKLWGEFVRLEAQVARNLCSLRRAKEASGPLDASKPASIDAAAEPVKELAPETDVWAPVRLIFRRSLAKLDASPQACAALLHSVTRCVEEAFASQPDPETASGPAAAGLQQWQRDLRKAVEDRRPGMATVPASWTDVADEVAAHLWELWWAQERAQGRGWRGVARAVLENAPLAAVRHCAFSLADAVRLEASGAPLKALSEFVASQRVASDGETALATLGALEPSIPFAEVQQHAATLVAMGAETSESGACSVSWVRLRLLALGANGGATAQQEGVGALLREASNMTGTDAAQLFALATADQSNAAGDVGHVLETLFRSLATDTSATPLVEAFLAKALLQGLPEFQAAADAAQAIGAKLWEAPRLRTELQAALLDAELRVLPLTLNSIQRLQARFEDLISLLNDADPAKVDWWVKYVEFAQRADHCGFGGNLPSSATLNWRATRSVTNQALYAERSQELQKHL